MTLSQTLRQCVVSHTRDLIEEHTDVNGEAPSGAFLAEHIALFVAGDDDGNLPPDHDREKVAEAQRLAAETAELLKAGMLAIPRIPTKQQDAIEARLRERLADLEAKIAAEEAAPTSALAVFGLRGEAARVRGRLGAITDWKKGLGPA